MVLRNKNPYCEHYVLFYSIQKIPPKGECPDCQEPDRIRCPEYRPYDPEAIDLSEEYGLAGFLKPEDLPKDL